MREKLFCNMFFFTFAHRLRKRACATAIYGVKQQVLINNAIIFLPAKKGPLAQPVRASDS